MYKHRTVHVLSDEDDGIQQIQQLAQFAKLMDSEVCLLAHINSRIFQIAGPDKLALDEARQKVIRVEATLDKAEIETGKSELTMQNLVDSSRLYCDASGADCIAMVVPSKVGRLSGHKKKIATTAQQNVLLLREAGQLPPNKVVCPVDGSPASAKGLRQAVMMAFAWGAHLQVVSVLGTPRLFASPKFGIDYPVSYNEIEAHIAHQEKHMAEFIDRHLQNSDGVAIEYLTDVTASEGILSFLAQQPQAFLVMGVAARDRFSSAILGNTSYQVATKAQNSTLLVRNNTY